MDIAEAASGGTGSLVDRIEANKTKLCTGAQYPQLRANAQEAYTILPSKTALHRLERLDGYFFPCNGTTLISFYTLYRRYPNLTTAP